MKAEFGQAGRKGERKSRMSFFILHPSSFILGLACLLLLAPCLLFGCLDWSDDTSPALRGGDDDDVTPDDDTDDDAGTPLTDNGDGTASDSSSGLTWQVTPSSDYMGWDYAKTYCQNLSLAGGGWHLPTVSELRTLIRGCGGTVTGGSCGVTDECLSSSSCWGGSCEGCAFEDGPDSGCYWPAQLEGSCYWYWSSSAVADYASVAWYVGFYYGHVSSSHGNYDGDVRCVR